MRKISETQNGSFCYGQVSIEFYETYGAMGLRGGLGWMKSLGSNMFLDINLNYNYLSSNVHFPIDNDNSAHLVQLPLNLKSFLTFDELKESSFDLNDSKWRIRKHSFRFIFNSWLFNLKSNKLTLHSDLNVGFKLKKWLIIEGILRGHYDIFATSFPKTTMVRYGLGVSVQPYKWKRLIPTAGISLEADYHDSLLRSILPTARKANVLVSDYNIGLEYRFNRHFSWSLQYTAPLFEVPSYLPTRPQLELGTVFHF